MMHMCDDKIRICIIGDTMNSAALAIALEEFAIVESLPTILAEETPRDINAVILGLTNVVITRIESNIDGWIEGPRRFTKEKAQWKSEMNGRKLK